MRMTALAKAELRIVALEDALRREHYRMEKPQPYPMLGSLSARKRHVETCLTCMLLAEATP